MFSIAQSQCLASAGRRDMHYAGKKEVYLHLGRGNFVFSYFPFSFSYCKYSLIKKKKRPVFLLQVLNNLWLLDCTRFLTGLKLVKYDFKCV